MNNIEIAKQTMKITKEKAYEISGKRIDLPEMDFRAVEVFSPKAGKDLLAWDISEKFGERMCRISVVNEDSFQAARRFEKPFVMNFANAHTPGGGFLLGANAQEEALCRCSTLYASITSKAASEMYVYNNTRLASVESDYMLLSPQVCVFRNERYELSEPEKIFQTAVITIPAPNRFGAAIMASGKLIEETMVRRIRIMLRIAAKKGYRNLILGAWGCGAFGNKPGDVSGYFQKVLIEEEYGRCFDEVCFAIYGSTDGKNITAFRERFS
ncbi:MAG: TIGR02452 family protein [Lachnospiraceae bacterium]|nr:TIGR02452 family protein [Lachnospiraceae bacterium]